MDSFHSRNQSKNQTQIINSLNSDNISVNSINNNFYNNNFDKTIDNSNNYVKNIKNNNDYEKGCFWMIERCNEEINDLNKNLDELFHEYEEKLNNSIKDSNNDNIEYYYRVVNNCVKWFFSALKSMINDINNKMEDWKNEIKKKC